MNDQNIASSSVKKFTVAVLGCGSRGACYTKHMLKTPDRFEVVALCDWDEEQLKKIHSLFGLENTNDFTDATVFLSEKRADVLVISTDDRYHVPQCVKAMELGYDVLVEKPLSDDREELELLIKTQQKTGRKVVVCYELRYGAGFKKCKELLEQGTVGELYSIVASERVAYWHWAHAYVRGVCSSLEKGHPAILAKCSHDLDLIQSYASSECETVSSVGSLSFFTSENMPDGAAERCVDCKHIESCPYSAKRVYIDAWHKAGEPEFCWPYNMVSLDNPTTEKALWEGINKGIYGYCAFNRNADQVDHQLVQMHFKNGVDATLSMVYSAEPGRRLSFYGTHGEILMDERDGNIKVMPYGEETEIIELTSLVEGGNMHGGGDGALIKELYGILTGEIKCKTPLRESAESHLMGIAAEESRLNGGVLVKVHN